MDEIFATFEAVKTCAYVSDQFFCEGIGKVASERMIFCFLVAIQYILYSSENI